MDRKGKGRIHKNPTLFLDKFSFIIVCLHPQELYLQSNYWIQTRVSRSGIYRSIFARFCILPFYHAESELTIGLCHLFSHFVHIFSHSVQNFIKNAKAACMTISRTPLRRSYHNYLLFSSRFKKASRFIFARSSVSFRLVFTFFTTFPS